MFLTYRSFSVHGGIYLAREYYGGLYFDQENLAVKNVSGFLEMCPFFLSVDTFKRLLTGKYRGIFEQFFKFRKFLTVLIIPSKT